MDDRIIEFSNILRRNGVRVSISETTDAFRALGLLGIGDGRIFKDTLRSTLVKRSNDLKIFDQLFDVYFLGLAGLAGESDRSLAQQLGLSPREFQLLLEEIRRLLLRGDDSLSMLARALLSGDITRVEALLLEAAEKQGLNEIQDSAQIESYVQLIMSYLRLSRVQEELEGFKAIAAQRGVGADSPERIHFYVDLRFKDLIDMIRRIVKLELKKSGAASWERNTLDYVAEKSFAYYTEDDIRRMNAVVTRLATRFKNLLSVKRRKAHKGRFDVKRTLRKNLQYGGVPFNIRFLRRRREKPQVVVLCDISDSVLNAARFMLQFLYSVQELYGKVRSFVFVSDIGEVTQLFEENNIQKAIDRTLKGEVIDVFTHSNFGRAFETFYKKHLAAVTGKTTFVIMGDGRNNYHPPNQWVLKEIRRKAKQLIWLNPESRLTWGVGDSEMPRYIPYCDVAEECRNINQLYRLINRITS
jgi:uncharacterized protein with von Willebrand factor type A (vWA) domain